MSTAKGLRRVRAGQGAIVLFEIGDSTFEMLRGHVALAFIPLFCAVAIVLAMLWLTGRIRRREYLDRPRPDYAAIARMEREVWGETFEHEGAPRTATLTIGTGGVSMAEAALGMQRLSQIMSGGPQATCPQGHGDQVWSEGRGKVCPECDRRWQDEHRSNLRWS